MLLLCSLDIAMSSVYVVIRILLEFDNMSVVNMLYKSGDRSLPCGTPPCISK